MKKQNLITSTKTCRQECDWNKVGIQKQTDGNGKVTRKKARLYCKGYAQEEGIEYGETFAPIARLERLRTLLAYSA